MNIHFINLVALLAFSSPISVQAERRGRFEQCSDHAAEFSRELKNAAKYSVDKNERKLLSEIGKNYLATIIYWAKKFEAHYASSDHIDQLDLMRAGLFGAYYSLSKFRGGPKQKNVFVINGIKYWIQKRINEDTSPTRGIFKTKLKLLVQAKEELAQIEKAPVTDIESIVEYANHYLVPAHIEWAISKLFPRGVGLNKALPEHFFPSWTRGVVIERLIALAIEDPREQKKFQAICFYEAYSSGNKALQIDASFIKTSAKRKYQITIDDGDIARWKSHYKVQVWELIKKFFWAIDAQKSFVKKYGQNPDPRQIGDFFNRHILPSKNRHLKLNDTSVYALSENEVVHFLQIERLLVAKMNDQLQLSAKDIPHLEASASLSEGQQLPAYLPAFALPQPDLDFLDESNSKQLADDLASAIDELEGLPRKIFILYYIKGLPLRQIKKITGKSPQSFNYHLHVAERVLREKLKKYNPHRPGSTEYFRRPGKIQRSPLDLSNTAIGEIF